MSDETRREFRLWKGNSKSDVADELAFHMQSAIDEGIAAGLTAEAARADAQRRFGDLSDVSRTLNELSVVGDRQRERRETFGNLRQDARFGLRQLRQSPGFTIVAIVTLALGIGASTAIFSMVDAVLLQPLAFADPSHVIDLKQVGPDGLGRNVVPVPNFLAWASENRAFVAIGGTMGQGFTLTGRGDPQRLNGLRASAGYWQAFQSPPVLGRYFSNAEDIENGPPVVVLSNAVFMNSFGGDRKILNQVIHLNENPYTVIGVASPAYETIVAPQTIWVPFAATARERAHWGDHEVAVTGRLRPGMTVDAAVQDVNRIEEALQHDHPDDGVTGKVIAHSAVEALVGLDAKRQFLVLLGAVALVLLIACANIANLLLARAITRRGEMAVRSALGAGRRRIVTQLLVESGVLALGGALLGAVLGGVILKGLVLSAPAGIPRLAEASINLRVLAFTAAATVVAGLLFGLAPAWRASRVDLQSTLRESGRSGAGGNDPLRSALVIGEIALALVLLTGAGLLLRSAIAMQREALGFRPEQLLTTRISLPQARYGDSLVAPTYDRILTAIRAIPGVASAAMISRMPIGGGGFDCGIGVVGGDPKTQYMSQLRSVSPGYFNTIGTRIIRGRAIDATDAAGSPLVTVLSAHLAHELFGDADPIGKQMMPCIGTGTGRSEAQARTVVGVAADVRANGVNQDFVEQSYYPYTQFFERSTAIVIRSSVDPLTLVTPVRRAVITIDPTLPLFRTASMESVIHDSTASPRFTMLLLILLGASGLMLAAIGIYGVISYQVGQRTREIGVRMALGATPGSVQWLVIRQALVVALMGVALGEVLATLSAHALAGLVYGVGTNDVMTFATVGTLLTITSLVASAVPARRSTKIEVRSALRA